jgi:nucleoporin NUP82
LRVKTFQLGPTAHVLEQAPVVSALWHPMGHMGSCLVTVTKDACVRLWELNRDSRASFDEPELALDLKKLANATSSEQDFATSRYGTSKGFSPDSVEMQVAAACFGARSTSDEHGWAPMTLWIAMTEGDVYALCPLLPSKWEPTPTTIPSLSTAVVAKAEAISQAEYSPEERRIVDQQQRWLADIDSQDPQIVSHVDTMAEFEVYNRPASPPAVPKLQGPFFLSPEPDYDQITDIFVIAPRLDDDALMQEEDQDDFLGHDGLSVGIICLATADGKVHICLDLDGVEAQWLPSRRAALKSRTHQEETVSELLLIETLITPETTCSWPTFTPTITSRYAFFLSNNQAIFNISLEPWIAALEDEFINPTDSGAAFRLDVLLDVEKSTVEQILNRNAASENATAATCISIVDSDLGHFILTTSASRPQAVVVELPIDRSLYTSFAPDDAPLALPAPAIRQPYQPSDAFSAVSALPGFLDTAVQRNARLRKSDLKTTIRFSPASLELLTDAHRLLSTETSRLGAAAADLFRRCDRMRAELSEQIRKVNEISKRAEAVTGDDDDGQDAEKPRIVGKEKIEERMNNARTRSKELSKRVEAMRRRMGTLGGRELSAKEEAWQVEVSALSASLGERVDAAEGIKVPEEDIADRFQAIAEMQRALIARARESTEQQQPDPVTPTRDITPPHQDESQSQDLSASVSRIPADFKQRKIAQVLQLLDRETALVDAVMDRLNKLGGLGEV